MTRNRLSLELTQNKIKAGVKRIPRDWDKFILSWSHRFVIAVRTEDILRT